MKSNSNQFLLHYRSYVDKPPSASPMPDIPITFELIAKGSQHGKDLLEDSHGYCYVIKVDFILLS